MSDSSVIDEDDKWGLNAGYSSDPDYEPSESQISSHSSLSHHVREEEYDEDVQEEMLLTDCTHVSPSLYSDDDSGSIAPSSPLWEGKDICRSPSASPEPGGLDISVQGCARDGGFSVTATPRLTQPCLSIPDERVTTTGSTEVVITEEGESFREDNCGGRATETNQRSNNKGEPTFFECDNNGGCTIIETLSVAGASEPFHDEPLPSTSGTVVVTEERESPDTRDIDDRKKTTTQPPVKKGGQKRVRNTQYCFYCEEPVLQFARHLERYHASEMEVVRLTSLKKQGRLKERKHLLSVIRNKGNFLSFRVTNAVKPVRKASLKRDASNPLPCWYCYGFFARKQLWRHVRRCPARKCGPQSAPHSQNLAQNMTLTQLEGDDYLKHKVFPHMRADSVTQCVKSDPLICAFGARFAKTHQQKHQINYISRKMRELGKLLMSMKKEEPRIKSLTTALTPEYYALLVKCAKEIAKFDTAEKRFNSPSFAMNIQASLKECCHVAINYLNQHGGFHDKTSYDEAVFPFERLVATINSEWKYDVSHQAGNDLQAASMNKVTIVPLATDLHRFREYLVTVANESVAKLQYDDHNVQAYKALLESVYCRVMLLCRKRCGELSRLTLEVYLASGHRNTYEEFADAIRPSEMLLVRKFKRVVIQGKRNPTPVIFSYDVQDHITVLLNLRPNFVVDSNPYLFANAHTQNPIRGYKVLTEHAKKAQLKYPEAVTSRSLRKHLATVCQVFCMSDEDVEQLSTFMGHTGTTHRKNYRLPDDIFQTAKVSKLLLMMEAGQAGQFKGKTLDEIDVDLEENVLTEVTVTDDSEFIDVSYDIEDDPVERVSTPTGGPSMTDSITTTTNPPNTDAVSGGTVEPKTKKQKFQRSPWSNEEKQVALSFFQQHVLHKRPPKKSECEAVIRQHPKLFEHRNWRKIKVFVVNEYSKKCADNGT